MIVQMDEKLKREMSREGSHLKYTRSRGGAGAGLIAAGVCFIVIAIMLAVALYTILGLSAVAVLLAGGLVLGAVFIVPGVFLDKRHTAGYMKYYVKKSGYAEAELNEFDREFLNGEAYVACLDKKLTKQSKFDSGIITNNWFKLPLMMPIKYSGLYRIVDVAAVFFEAKPIVNGERLNPTLFVVDNRGDGMTVSMKENVGNEIVREISKRNPRAVTTRRISYNGKDYDALYQYQEVAGLYREICKSR